MRRGRATLGVLAAGLALLAGCTAASLSSGSAGLADSATATSSSSTRTLVSHSTPPTTPAVHSGTSGKAPPTSTGKAPSIVNGERSATASPSPPVPHPFHQLVGLGDSVPAASACDCAGFVADVAQRLSLPGHQVKSVNLATPGSISSDLKDDLTDADERSTIAASDVVLLEIGANDMTINSLTDPSCLGSDNCWRSDLNSLDVNIRQILSTLRRLRPADPAVIAVLGYWNVGQSGDVGAAKGPTYVQNARMLTASVNRLLAKDCASTAAIYVDTDAAFGSDDRAMTSLLASDGDHPNADGHDVLAAAVVTAIRTAGD